MPQSHDSQPQRKIYSTPQLRLYGSVQALTAGGTGPVSEANDPLNPAANQKCNGNFPGGNTFNQHVNFKHCN